MRFGNQWLIVSVALLVVLVVMRVPWYGGLALFIPVALSAVGFLQASRNTCVMRAKEGTFEHDDFSATKAPDDGGRRQPRGRRQDQPRRHPDRPRRRRDRRRRALDGHWLLRSRHYILGNG